MSSRFSTFLVPAIIASIALTHSSAEARQCTKEDLTWSESIAKCFKDFESGPNEGMCGPQSCLNELKKFAPSAPECEWDDDMDADDKNDTDNDQNSDDKTIKQYIDQYLLLCDKAGSQKSSVMPNNNGTAVMDDDADDNDNDNDKDDSNDVNGSATKTTSTASHSYATLASFATAAVLAAAVAL